MLGAALLDFSDLKPDEKVNLAIGMTDVCIRICSEGIRNQHPEITENKLLELLRERLAFSRQLNTESRKWPIRIINQKE
jgi:hypothetical protein